MIRFARVPEPEDFDERAKALGTRWLAAHPDAKRPKDFWTPFKGALAQGFRSLCAYSAMYEPVGTVDHFVSCHEDLSKGRGVTGLKPAPTSHRALQMPRVPAQLGTRMDRTRPSVSPGHVPVTA